MIYALFVDLVTEQPQVIIDCRKTWQKEAELFRGREKKEILRWNNKYYLSQSKAALRDFGYQMIDEQISKLKSIEIPGCPRKINNKEDKLWMGGWHNYEFER